MSDFAETLRDGGKWRAAALVGEGVASSPMGGGRRSEEAEGRRRLDGRSIAIGLGRELGLVDLDDTIYR